MVAAAVDELDGEGPDGVGTEPAALGVGAQEEVDAGVAEVGLVLLDGLDVADDLAVVLDDERVLLGIAVDELADRSVDGPRLRGRTPAPPARDRRGSWRRIARASVRRDAIGRETVVDARTA